MNDSEAINEYIMCKVVNKPLNIYLRTGSHYTENLLRPVIASRCKKLEIFLTFCRNALRVTHYCDFASLNGSLPYQFKPYRLVQFFNVWVTLLRARMKGQNFPGIETSRSSD